MNKKSPDVIKIAKVAHEVNRAYCQSIGDFTKFSWDKSANWVKESAINGVLSTLDNPHRTPNHHHNSWLSEKIQNGWKYGETLDDTLKTHPCIVEYDKLPPEQKSKDFIFKAVVKGMIGNIGENLKELNVLNERMFNLKEQIDILEDLTDEDCIKSNIMGLNRRLIDCNFKALRLEIKSLKEGK